MRTGLPAKTFSTGLNNVIVLTFTLLLSTGLVIFNIFLGRDYPNYVYFIENLVFYGSDEWKVEAFTEKVSFLIAPLAGATGVVVFHIFLSLYLKLLYFSKAPNKLLLFFIYACLFLFLWEGNQLRIALSASVMLFAIRYFQEQKMLPFLILATISAIIHVSILVVYIPLLKKKYLFAALAVLSLILLFIRNLDFLSFYFVEFIVMKAGIYADDYLFEQERSFFNVGNALVLILIILWVLRFRHRFKGHIASTYFYFMVGTFICSFFLQALFVRILDLYIFMVVIYMVQSLKRKDILIAFFLSLFSIVYFIIFFKHVIR